MIKVFLEDGKFLFYEHYRCVKGRNVVLPDFAEYLEKGYFKFVVNVKTNTSTRKCW